MGRKGMKAFMKAVKSGPEEDAQQEVKQPEPQTTSSKTAEVASVAAMAERIPGPSESQDLEVVIPGKETKGQMLQRHKRETVAHKKQTSRLGKKNKEEADALTKQLEDRHAAELKELETAQGAAQAAAPLPSIAEALALSGPSKYLVSTEAEPEQQQPSKRVSKAQKRREKHAQKQFERDARIAEENAALGPSQKQEEEARLLAKLRPLGLKIHEVRSDGHCLYRALEHQLQLQGPVSDVRDYLDLRKLTAQYIRAHSDDFLPFILAEEQSEECDNPQQLVDSYCQQVEDTAAWGGQLEIRALAGGLQRHIKVHVADLQNVEMGDEFSSQGVLHLCYLRHAFALGEHFNSVEPLGAEDEQQGKQKKRVSFAGVEDEDSGDNNDRHVDGDGTGEANGSSSTQYLGFD